MKSYQDLEAIRNESGKTAFIRDAINEHRVSPQYHIAADAERYYAKHNVTIERYQKMLFNMHGAAVPDMWSANYKIKTLFFRRFVIQQTQYVLANGTQFEKPETKDRLGITFDTQLQKLAKKALVDGVAFGFWDNDHLEVFSYADTPNSPAFCPLYDLNTSLLRAGIRYWYIKVGDKVSTRATLYEEDGYTEYLREYNKEFVILEPKRGYKKTTLSTTEMGVEAEIFSNYEGFPIIPMYANDLHTSELEGIRESIDCYDFIKSGLANDIDDTSGFYWVLKNTGGMDDIDLAKFVERMKTVRAAVVDGDSGVDISTQTMEIPVEAREKMLDRLERDLYKDFQILNVSELSATQKTATEIRAAYQSQDDKCGDFEYCIIEFIQRLFKIVGIEDNPTFKWNRIANQTEETNMILSAANYLDDETVLKHLPFLTPEEVPEIIKRRDVDNISQFNPAPEDDVTEEE